MSPDAAAASAPPRQTLRLDTGNYEVLRARLQTQGDDLRQKVQALNVRRRELFGGSELEVVGNERLRTHHACVPRDLVALGQRLLLGANVVLGMKASVEPGDLLSLQTMSRDDEGSFSFEPVAGEAASEDGAELLEDAQLKRELGDLYRYGGGVRLLQLRATEDRLLAVFEEPSGIDKQRVFQWTVAGDQVSYVDARGQPGAGRPPTHPFTWTATDRKDHVEGKHPHVSIQDVVFVETVGGDLTIKVEDNTEDGAGIYSEPVFDRYQALEDAQILYARVGDLVLLRVLPFREEDWRHFVFSARTKQVHRIDALGRSCARLPADQGIIYPGGYVLQTGERHEFTGDVHDLELERVLRAPNGEDALYVFHHYDQGSYALYPYNMIRKEVGQPIHCHGFALQDDGLMIVLRVLSQEPSQSHPVQLWRTPFASTAHAASAQDDGSHLSKLGNAELVHGVSDALALTRLIAATDGGRRQPVQDVVDAVTQMTEAYYWLDHEEVGDLLSTLVDVRKAAALMLAEFGKVQEMRAEGRRALDEEGQRLAELEAGLTPEAWTAAEHYLDAMTALRVRRGHIETLKEQRYMDLERVAVLEAQVVTATRGISGAAIVFLQGEGALTPIVTQLDALAERAEAATKAAELPLLAQDLDRLAEGLTALSEVVSGLEVDDAAARTSVLDRVSEAFSHVNRARATLQARRSELLGSEAQAEFATQFRLFGQQVTNGLTLADTPERCDEQLSRLTGQLQELESRFSELDEYLEQLAAKREELTAAFDARRQTLTDQRQRRAHNLLRAAERILDGIARRSRGFKDLDELNGYFASDAMVIKVRGLADELLELDDSVKADEVASSLKSTRQEAVRALRDRLDLFAGGEGVIQLGPHRFNVNTAPAELTLVPGRDGMALHVTGTDFLEQVDDPAFQATRPFWEQVLVSENPEVYRAEYLAALILEDAERAEGEQDLGSLVSAWSGGTLDEVVRAFAAERYDEGYERGLHDADAAKILAALLQILEGADQLRYPASARSRAVLWWAAHVGDEPAGDVARALARRAQSLGRLLRTVGPTPAGAELARELAGVVARFLDEQGIACTPTQATLAGRYLQGELASPEPSFVIGSDARQLESAFLAHLDATDKGEAFKEDLRTRGLGLAQRFQLAQAWLSAFLERSDQEHQRAALLDAIDDVAAHLVVGDAVVRWEHDTPDEVVVEGVLGQHPRVRERRLTVNLSRFEERLVQFQTERVPAYRAYREQVHALLEDARVRLRLDELQPRVLSTFVRNRLIDEVYLHMVGQNLAKQLGTAGEDKRTDLMGLLLLISPPGYGKTTLMEYVASRLGLLFVKVNGPTLGHSVTSLDPADAPSATARQEVEKINFALEMGNNVMLYLDDIQHTHPELLQKFISLCDGQRRIEGVWRGRTRTYDLRGKKFVVCMAGNPYTEAGERFQIPDMLANRADTYNLGDVLAGKEELFALSFLENALTSNPVLAPLSARDPKDVHRLIARARGEEVPTEELTHAYSALELEEITAVLARLSRALVVLLKVNQTYILSAGQEDAFRTEPRFQLQGSYRNMNKIAERVSAAMNDAELWRVIEDHYLGEAQTLTTGAEHNLLKLAELCGKATPEQTRRWEEVKRTFSRLQLMGSSGDDPVARVVGQLSGLGEQVHDLRQGVVEAVGKAILEVSRERTAAQGKVSLSAPTPKAGADPAALRELLSRLDQVLQTATRPQIAVRLEQDQGPLVQALERALAQQVEVVRSTLVPVLDGLAQTLRTHQHLNQDLAEMLGYAGERRVTLRRPAKDLIPDDDPEPRQQRPAPQSSAPQAPAGHIPTLQVPPSGPAHAGHAPPPPPPPARPPTGRLTLRPPAPGDRPRPTQRRPRPSGGGPRSPRR
jgi:ATPase involved in DNA repair/ATPase family associated with various cellular activities (AAA)